MLLTVHVEKGMGIHQTLLDSYSDYKGPYNNRPLFLKVEHWQEQTGRLI